MARCGLQIRFGLAPCYAARCYAPIFTQESSIDRAQEQWCELEQEDGLEEEGNEKNKQENNQAELVNVAS